MSKSQNPVRVLSKPIYGRGIGYYVYAYAMRFTGGINAKIEFFHAPHGTEGDSAVVTTTEFICDVKVGDSIICSGNQCTVTRLTPKTIWTDSTKRDWKGNPLNKLHVSDFCETNLLKKA